MLWVECGSKIKYVVLNRFLSKRGEMMCLLFAKEMKAGPRDTRELELARLATAAGEKHGSLILLSAGSAMQNLDSGAVQKQGPAVAAN